MFHSYQINTAKGILDTILSVQPKEGGGGGGETRESIVYRLADDMLEKLPKQYNSFEVCGRALCSINYLTYLFFILQVHY